MAECRDCGRELGGDAGFFELCSDHDLECLPPVSSSIEVADVAIVALHWAARRAVKFVIGAADE